MPAWFVLELLRATVWQRLSCWKYIHAHLLTEHARSTHHLLKDVLANVAVHSTERIVQQVDVTVLVHSTRQGHTLLLPAAQVDALHQDGEAECDNMDTDKDRWEVTAFGHYIRWTLVI